MNGEQRSTTNYLIVIGVHSTMHLIIMHPNYYQITIIMCLRFWVNTNLCCRVSREQEKFDAYCHEIKRACKICDLISSNHSTRIINTDPFVLIQNIILIHNIVYCKSCSN